MYKTTYSWDGLVSLYEISRAERTAELKGERYVVESIDRRPAHIHTAVTTRACDEISQVSGKITLNT